MTPENFKKIPIVLNALSNPCSPRSILNYMCGCDTSKPQARQSLNTEAKVEPLLHIWFASGTTLDTFCQPFAEVVRKLKTDPPVLIGDEWDSLDGKVAKVLLADQLSRSCFRGTSEAFSFDIIAQNLVHELFSQEMIEKTLKLPAAFLYLLPWALAHSEKLKDLDLACEFINKSINAYPDFSLFKGRNKQAVNQHRQVLEKFGRYPQRNAEFGRINTEAEKIWLDDKENLPVWAGGKLSFDKKIL